MYKYASPHGSIFLTASQYPGRVTEDLVVRNLVRMMENDDNFDEDTDYEGLAESVLQENYDRIRIMSHIGEYLVPVEALDMDSDSLQEELDSVSFSYWKDCHLPISESEWEHGNPRDEMDDSDTFRELSDKVVELSSLLAEIEQEQNEKDALTQDRLDQAIFDVLSNRESFSAFMQRYLDKHPNANKYTIRNVVAAIIPFGSSLPTPHVPVSPDFTCKRSDIEEALASILGVDTELEIKIEQDCCYIYECGHRNPTAKILILGSAGDCSFNVTLDKLLACYNYTSEIIRIEYIAGALMLSEVQ